MPVGTRGHRLKMFGPASRNNAPAVSISRLLALAGLAEKFADL